MPLYIRDNEVDVLAEKLRAALGARTKTEAVRAALRHELERLTEKKSFADRNAKAFELADRLGAPDPAFDEKAFMDEMWDD